MHNKTVGAPRRAYTKPQVELSAPLPQGKSTYNLTEISGYPFGPS